MGHQDESLVKEVFADGSMCTGPILRGKMY